MKTLNYFETMLVSGGDDSGEEDNLPLEFSLSSGDQFCGFAGDFVRGVVINGGYDLIKYIVPIIYGNSPASPGFQTTPFLDSVAAGNQTA